MFSEALVVVFLLLLRHVFKSFDTRAMTATAPGDMIARLAEAQRRKQLHPVVFGPADRSTASHCIVLLHGWGQSSSAWVRTAESLHAQYPNAVIIVPDLLGHGRSSNACPTLGLHINLFVEQVNDSANICSTQLSSANVIKVLLSFCSCAD